MTLMRSTLFNVFLILITLILGIVGLPFLLGPRKWVCRLRDLWISLVLAVLRWTVGLTHRVEGLENLPPGAYMVASKHQSAWETLALHTIFRDPAIVLKRELLKLPILGYYIRRVGMVPIDRTGRGVALKSMMGAARKWSAVHRPILIFPQGTRIAPGMKESYHSGVFAIYRTLGLPVVPVALNSGLFWPRQAFLKRPGMITVRILPAIPKGLERREFMTTLERVIETASDELLVLGVD